jgi:hypothetical protein
VRLLLLAFALALPAAAAYAAIQRAWSEPGCRVSSLALRAGLALPLGLGAASLFTYAWLLAGGALDGAYASVDSVLFASILAAARLRRTPTPPGPAAGTPEAPGRSPILERSAAVVAAVALAVVAAWLVRQSVARPHGGWDAWGIWNMRARFLFRAGDDWRLAFSPALGYSHLGYPLFLPTAVARLWAFSGETTVAPAAVAVVFTLAPALAVAGAVSRRSGRVAGGTAALLLVAAEGWVSFGASQCADVPLASFIAAGAASLVAARRRDGTDDAGLLALAGASLGLATWTKDEGLPLALVFGAWALAFPGGGPRRRRAAALAAGAALPVLVTLSFRALLSPGFAEVFTRGQTAGGALQRLLALERWRVILAALPENLPGAEAGLPIVAVVAAIALGASWRELPRSAAIPALAASAGFLFVYALTPLDLRWHLRDSAARVLIQPWPAFVLGVFQLIPARSGHPAAPSA